MKYLLFGIFFIFLVLSCSKNINLENGFIQYLEENKNNIVFYIVNDDATTEFRNIYRQLSDKEIFDEIGNLIIDYNIPENNKIIGFYNIKDNWDETFYEYLIIHDEVINIGNYFLRMDKKLSEYSEIGVILTFYLNSDGSNIFYELTSNNINNSLAIVIDDKAIVNPRIVRPLERSVNFSIRQ